LRFTRASGEGGRIKAGSYEIKPGYTPQRLLLQLVRGEFAQEALTVIEGWTFKQMRKAIADQPALKHDTATWTDQQILAKLTNEYTYPEGLFFPDTYLFAKGASDMQVYKQAFALMSKKLNEAWARRDLSLPYRTPYEALTMASIVEKETGQKSERGMVAGVFVNRLRTGMLLQTDPTVIYGMGDRYQGKIRKVDLLTDTPTTPIRAPACRRRSPCPERPRWPRPEPGQDRGLILRGARRWHQPFLQQPERAQPGGEPLPALPARFIQ
jgi:UPF0755 protein